MELGIFAKTFHAEGIDANFAAVQRASIPAVQYNLSIAGLDTVPSHVDEETVDAIRAGAQAHGVTLSALSGTFNAAHPDEEVRQAGIDRFPELARVAAALQIPIITLCSGSRDPENMWRYHPDNSSTSAWEDSRDSLIQLAQIAHDAGVIVAVEPEHTNVVATAQQGRQMLDEVGSRALKIVFDAANILDTDNLNESVTGTVIDSALELLGPDIALAHAKELAPGRPEIPAGTGFLPWPRIFRGLADVGFDGTVVTHGLAETNVASAVAFLNEQLEVVR